MIGKFGQRYGNGFAMQALMPGGQPSLTPALDRTLAQYGIEAPADSVVRIGTPSNQAAERELASRSQPRSSYVPATPPPGSAWAPVAPPVQPPMSSSPGSLPGTLPPADTGSQVLQGIAVGGAFLLVLAVGVRLLRG